jgi:hypothetical protein
VRFAIPAGATTASRSDLLTIPAGAATAAVTVRVLADASFPAERDLAVALAAQPADAPRYRIAGTAAIVIRALATAQTVGIAPLVGSVEEGAAGDAFILERAGTAEMIAAALRVDLALVASASSATAADLVAVPAQAVFAAAATRAVVTIAAADDRLPEPATEALVLRIAGADAPITIAAAASRAAVAIRDRAPRVRISRAADALEGGDLRFEITVDPAAGAAVAVPWSVAGAITAADLASGAATSGTAVVAAGAATAAITVATRDDLAAEADESAVLTIAPGAGLVLSGPATAAATLVDITPSVVVGWIADGAEPALPARFIVAYGGTALARPATVALTATGPVGGVPATVTIPAGATSATLRLLPIDDRAVQAPRQVVVAIAAVDGSARASGTAAAWILDDDPGIRVVNEPDEVVVPAGSTWSHRVRVTLSDRAVQGPLTAALVAPPGGSAPPSWLTIGTPEELETGTVEIPLDGIAAGAGPVLVRIAITAAIPDDPESVTVSTVDLILVVAPAGAGEG